MSHFTVMVFGDNPEDLLAPYDENIRVDEYESGTIEEDELQRFREYYVKENPDDSSLSMVELYEKHGDDWNDRSWKFENDKWIEYSTYNPKSKWDWYQLGGRWTGFFKLKEGSDGQKGSPGIMTELAPEGRADALYKKDIDIDGMRKEEEDRAAIIYDKAQEIFDRVGRDYIRFEDIEGEIEDRRVKFHEQALIKAFMEQSDIFGYMSDIEDYLVPKEKYLQDARNAAITPFAFITPEGEWIEKGKMGWWAMVSDEKKSEDWNKQFSDYFDSLPDDTMISLVDCHI